MRVESGEPGGEFSRKERSDFIPGERVDSGTVRLLLDQLEEQGGIGRREMERVEELLRAKSSGFREVLAESVGLDEEGARGLLRSVYSTRRRTDEVLETLGGPAGFSEAVEELLRGDGPVEERFDAFHGSLRGVDPRARYSLASELLHFHSPEEHHLWTHWMWDPEAETGALPLMTGQDVELAGETPGETYLLVGEASGEVLERSDEMGLPHLEPPFGADVAAASIHCVYTNVALTTRMTKEFTEMIPGPVEYVRKVLGADELEVTA